MIGSVRLSLQPKYLIFDLCQIFFLFPQFAQGFPLIAKVLKRIRGQDVSTTGANTQRQNDPYHERVRSLLYLSLLERLGNQNLRKQ